MRHAHTDHRLHHLPRRLRRRRRLAGVLGLEGPEYLAWLADQPEHALLMGATTYRLMSGFAAAGEDDPLAATPKYVFSSTLREPLAWPNTTLVTGDAVAAVRALTEQDGPPLSTLGSLSLCRALLDAGLVDRFRVVIFPVITGRTGRERIFDGYPDLLLDLVQSRTFDAGIQLLEYVPRPVEASPGPAA